MTAYLLVQTAIGSCPAAARSIGELVGVRSVHQVTGPYDIVVELESRSARTLAEAIPLLQEISGVTRVLPCLPPGA